MSIYKSKEAELLHRGQEVTQWVNVDGIWKPVDEFGYEYGEFPPCEAKCGTKTVYRSRTCKMNGTVVVDDAICQAAGTVQEQIGLTCGGPPCTLSCSASCGGGGCSCTVRFEPLPMDFGSNPRIHVKGQVWVDRIGGTLSMSSPGGFTQLQGYAGWWSIDRIFVIDPKHRIPGGYFGVTLGAAKPSGGCCNSVSLTVTLMLD